MQVGALKLQPMELDKIPLIPQEANPEIVTISEDDGFFLNTRKADDFRIRKPVYERMKQAQTWLPQGTYFMIFEAYRPLARQIRMWKAVNEDMSKKYPDVTPDELQKICENFIANPYDGIGSGHQACCAIDVSLCDENRIEFDMGNQIQEFNEKTRTDSKLISPEGQKNRRILKDSLEKAGLINYPAEWWHFSYGDHQWAWLTGSPEAIYGPIDI